MVDAMKTTIGEEEPKVSVYLDLRIVHEKSMPDFITRNAMKLFSALDIPTNFLETPPSTTSKMILEKPLTETSLFYLKNFIALSWTVKYSVSL